MHAGRSDCNTEQAQSGSGTSKSGHCKITLTNDQAAVVGSFAASHAAMPPTTLAIASKPFCSRRLDAIADRNPPAQSTAMRLLRSTVSTSSLRWLKGNDLAEAM